MTIGLMKANKAAFGKKIANVKCFFFVAQGYPPLKHKLIYQNPNSIQ